MIDWAVVWSIYGWGVLATLLFCSCVFVLTPVQIGFVHIVGALISIVFWPLVLPVLIIKLIEGGA